jgi:type I restriction enzyme S subunit
LVGISDELIELPEGWVWTTLDEIMKKIVDGTHHTPTYVDDGIPFLSVKDIRDGQINFDNCKYISQEEHDKLCQRCHPEYGDLLITKSGTIGRCAVVQTKRDFSLFVSVALFKPATSEVNITFISLAFQSWFQSINVQNDVTGTAIKNFHLVDFRKLALPLPPLNEQKRIVAKIEELNDRTQKAKEALDSIPQLCDRFRQSVLAAAFRGDLTADWREQNSDVEPASVLLEKVQKDREIYTQQNKCLSLANIDKLPQIPETWIWCATENLSTFESNSICAGPFGTIFKAKDFRESGIPIIFLRHVGEGKYLTHKPGFMDVDKWQELFQPYSVWGGELLVTKLGEPPGICAIYPKGIGPAMVTPDVIKMSVNNSAAETTYLMHYFNSRISKSFAFGSAYGVTRLRLNLPIFRQMPVPLAPFREQQEIIFRIQSLFKAADTIEQQYQKSKARLDQLNQSILAKAFRGELVPQDPDDEPASVLLERIRAERDKLNNSKPKSDRTSKRKRKTAEGQGTIPGL